MSARREWYPDNWRKIKMRTEERDEFICQNCGHYGGPEAYVGVSADFMTPPPQGGATTLENTWTLCPGCHQTVGHGQPPHPAPKETRNKIGNLVIWAVIGIPVSLGISAVLPVSITGMVYMLGFVFVLLWPEIRSGDFL
jgi:hypothetical protein